MWGWGADEVHSKYEADLGEQHVSWSPTLLSAGGCKGWFFPVPSPCQRSGAWAPHTHRERRGGPCPGGLWWGGDPHPGLGLRVTEKGQPDPLRCLTLPTSC